MHEDETSTGDWVARDGSTINHGSIDPEVDFYDPEDNELFGSDDDPDDEEYEGFTGNAGEVQLATTLVAVTTAAGCKVVC